MRKKDEVKKNLFQKKKKKNDPRRQRVIFTLNLREGVGYRG